MSNNPALSIRQLVQDRYGTEPGGFLSLWVRQTKETRFFLVSSDLAELERAIEELAPRCDLYLGLSLQEKRLASTKRGSAETTVVLASFFADIDFGSAKDGTKNYPADEAEALEILDKFPFKPTEIVRTGNGLHAQWFFDKPWRFKTRNERDAAANLSSRFQKRLFRHFKQYGREIDSVGDLCRNYRIPGTLNHKSVPPKNVETIVYDPTRRISPADVETWLRESGGDPVKRKPRLAATLKHPRIQQNCAWYRDVTGEGAATCDEPNWYAAASITARCENGSAIFHDYSARHPKYEVKEAAEKFEHAKNDAGPRSCENIENELGHSGCASCPHHGRITSPAQLGRSLEYEPGEDGPLALGYTRDGQYVLLDQVRRIVIYASPQQLLSQQYLVGVAPSFFWRKQFPAKKALFDQQRAGEAVIAACKKAGPFTPQRVRGRGIWRDGSNIVINLGGDVPTVGGYLYLCFEPIDLNAAEQIDAKRLLALLQLFPWRNPHDAVLLLGWLAIAPICGVLAWRPHCFVYGPPRSGKTTLHTIAVHLLTPLVISADGGSSEAGIRQTVGPDSLPVSIDEFESDQNGARMAQIVRLARSASSAENPVLRGTPEGKAMQFSLRTTFFFSGINPRGMSPADESRIVQLELMMHGNDRKVSEVIRAEERHFRELGPSWCAEMVRRAEFINPALEMFLEAFLGADRRHLQNMSTLLAGAFVALHGRLPTKEEVVEWSDLYGETIKIHAQELDRDDAAECLDRLFAHDVEGYPLGHWVGVAFYPDTTEKEFVKQKAQRIVRSFDLIIHRGNEFEGLLIRNGSPKIEQVFERTQWDKRAWMKALRKLDGARVPLDPIHFPNTGRKHRCVCLPYDVIPEPMEMDAEADAGADEISGGRY